MYKCSGIFPRHDLMDNAYFICLAVLSNVIVIETYCIAFQNNVVHHSMVAVVILILYDNQKHASG